MPTIPPKTADQASLIDTPGGCGAVIRYSFDHDRMAREYGVILCGTQSQAIDGKRTWFRCESCLSAEKA
ncbi:MAG: hypothetical protein CMJ29_13515 [Phycisphaerae bacterium]|nr:hypothetical protein [Phycisphaerae bacterium]